MTFDKEFKANLKDETVEEVLEKLAQSVPETLAAAQNNAVAVAEALEAIKKRSYSGRNPQLGKMIKCQICKIRHRDNERKCVQKFHVLDNEEQIAGQTPQTAPDITVEAEIGRKKVRIAIGAAAFNGKRKNPHLNRRKLQYVHLVHQLLEDGYTQEELAKARRMATHILVQRWGRYHFMESPIDKKLRLAKEAENVQETNS